MKHHMKRMNSIAAKAAYKLKKGRGYKMNKGYKKDQMSTY